mgnify:CR=1 FL=1
MEPFSLWITGISGAGKTTLATTINNILNSNNYVSVILDGDSIRSQMNQDLGFSMEDRDENVRRIACMSELLSQQKNYYDCLCYIPHETSTCICKKSLWPKF